MENLQEKKLALFFSKGVSLKTWQDIGSLAREVKPYKELAKSFKNIYFFTYGGKDNLEFQKGLPANVKIFPRRYLPTSLYYFFLPLLRRKELQEVDIFKTNQMSAVLPALFSKWLYKKKLVVRCGYEWLWVLKKEKKPLWKRLIVSILGKLAYRTADKIILTSQKDKKFVQKRFNIPEEKIEVIPNYIDTELFKPQEKEKKEGILYVGRLSKEKNLLNLVRAVRALQVNGQRLPLTLIGKGPLEEELRELAGKVGALVEFKGKVANEDLPKELNKAKVFVLPSLYEGCPKALLEAMACGVCCVASNVEGISEVIQHKQNGYLCGTAAEEIKKALQEVLADNHLRQKLGQSARETILQRFSLNNILNKETALYAKLRTF